MALAGYVVPVSQQSTEGFHALRRTTEGLLYYTKINKDSTDTIDIESGSPTDFNGNKQYSDLQEYVDEIVEFQSSPQIFSGDGSDTTFTVTNGATVDSVVVTENGIVQRPTNDYTISGTTLTFTTAPATGVAIQIRELPVSSS